MADINLIPSLVVGLGGTGFLGAAKVKKFLAEIYLEKYMLQHKEVTHFPGVKFLSIDTVIQDKNIKGGQSYKDLALKYKDELTQINQDGSIENIKRAKYLFSTEQYLLKYDVDTINKFYEKPDIYKDFIPEDIFQAGVRATAEGAGGYPINGKMSLVLDFQNVKNMIRKAVDELLNPNLANEIGKWGYNVVPNKINIFIITSFGGGTGRGTFITFSAMVRQILNNVLTKPEDGKVFIFNFLPDCFETEGRKVGIEVLKYIKNNEYSSFKEIEHVIKRGYKAEDFFCDSFGMDKAKREIQKSFDGVINISSKSRAGNIDSYEKLNDVIGQFVSFWIMGGNVGKINENISNFEKTESTSPLVEKITAIRDRKHVYSRIGFNHWRFPEHELFEFAKYDLAKQVCTDIIDGSLTDETILKQKKNIEEFANNEMVELFNGFEKVPQIINSMSAELSKTGIAFENIDNVKVSDLSNYFGKTLTNFKNTAAKYEEDNLDILFEDEIKKFKDKIVDLVDKFGIETTIKFLNVSNSSLIQQVNNYFKKQLRNELPKYLSNNQNTMIKEEEVTINNIGNLKQSLYNTIEGMDKELLTYTNSSKYNTIQEKLLAIKEEWKSNRGLFSKMFSGDEVCDGTKAQPLFQSEISGFNNIFEEYKKYEKYIFILNFVSFYSKKISKYANKLSDNYKLIYNPNTRCLIEDFKENCQKTVSSIKDNVIISNTPDDFRAFIQAEFNYYELSKKLEKLFNEKFLRDIIDKNVNEESALENFLIAKSEELLDTIHYDEQKKSRFTLLSYIKKIINQGNIGEFGGKLERFFNQSEYMGNLDVSTVTNPGQLSANPNEMKFLFLDDGENIIKKFMTHVSVDKYSYMQSLNSNTISIFKIQPTLPIFCFEVAKECQVHYNNTKTEFASGKLNKDMGARHFDIQNHTSSEFLKIQEPFGTTFAVPVDAFPAMISTGLHIGAFFITREGYLCSMKNNNAIEEKDFAKIPLSDSEIENNLLISEYLKNPTDYQEQTKMLIRSIATKIMNILNNSFVIRNIQTEGVSYLQNYMTNYNDYPIFHPNILENVIKTMEDLNMPKHNIKYLKDKQPENKKIYTNFVQIMPNYPLTVQTMFELREAFPNYDLSIYKKVSVYEQPVEQEVEQPVKKEEVKPVVNNVVNEVKKATTTQTTNTSQSEYAYSYTQSDGNKKTDKNPIKLDKLVEIINTLSDSEKDSFKVWKKGWTPTANKWTQYREIEEISALVIDIPDDEDDMVPDPE